MALGHTLLKRLKRGAEAASRKSCTSRIVAKVNDKLLEEGGSTHRKI